MKKLIFNFKSNKNKKFKLSRYILGGKGLNLSEMRKLGLPVPPGFTITTEVCELFYKNKKQLPFNLIKQIKKELSNIEKDSKKKFGDFKNPLLVSVRSGARVSMPGMMDTILNLGLNDKDVSFKGYIEGELDKFLLDFDIYVFPSLLEGLPFSILEAMKFSLPIITTSAGGITEAIEHNKNGIIVDMNSPESFVREIKNLIGNEKLSNNLSSNAFETFNKKFSHEIMYSNFKNLLDEI